MQLDFYKLIPIPSIHPSNPSQNKYTNPIIPPSHKSIMVGVFFRIELVVAGKNGLLRILLMVKEARYSIVMVLMMSGHFY